LDVQLRGLNKSNNSFYKKGRLNISNNPSNGIKGLIRFAVIWGLSIILLTKIYAQDVQALSNQKDLESLKDSKKGKVVLVNFWATWCKPCVAEFPEIVKLYRDYKDKGFELVFVSVDVTEDIKTKVVPFLKKQGVDFTTYYSNFDNPEDLINFFDKNWQGAIPSTYIYDRNWNQTSNMLGEKKYEVFENEILKNLN
jgi:thiol-disulfide isomerase/thioredoxin